MFSENRWKVILLVVASVVAAEPGRALSVYQKPYKNVMFVPKSLYRRPRPRQSRVLFLDEDENHQPFGKGEIDLTQDKTYSKIKFDESPDYEFTSSADGTDLTKKPNEDLPSGNERFYEPLPRFRPYQNFPHYYQGRFGRSYAPNYGFDYPVAPFAPALRNSFSPVYPGWKPRSPRVVFPYASDNVNSVQTNSHAGPGGPGGLAGPTGPVGPTFNDNVVFREQNFGLNDIGDEQQLQDIGTGAGDGFVDRDANDLHRARYETTDYKNKRKKHALEKPMFIQTDKAALKRVDIYAFPNVTNRLADLPKFKPISDEQMFKINKILEDMPRRLPKRKGRLLEPTNSVIDAIQVTTESIIKPDQRQDGKRCAQGGTCEFFFYCWMVGGLLDGSCGSLLKGCCHRVAKAGILGVQDSNSLDYGNEGLSYGPVVNDESK